MPLTPAPSAPNQQASMFNLRTSGTLASLDAAMALTMPTCLDDGSTPGTLARSLRGDFAKLPATGSSSKPVTYDDAGVVLLPAQSRCSLRVL